jgi:hypothetical protein
MAWKTNITTRELIHSVERQKNFTDFRPNVQDAQRKTRIHISLDIQKLMSNIKR